MELFLRWRLAPDFKKAVFSRTAPGKQILLAALLLATSGFGALCQSQPEVLLYEGREVHTLEAIPFSNPPFISLDDLLASLQLEPGTRNGTKWALTVNRRPLVLDLTRQEALLSGHSEPLAIQERNGKWYLQVQGAARIFTRLLGRSMIFEPSTRTLHLPKSEELTIKIRSRSQANGYKLSLAYSKSIDPPKVEKSGRKLIVKIHAEQILIDRDQFQANEAVTGMEVFSKLPDGSTEIVFLLGGGVKKFRAEGYSPGNPITLIKLEGDFNELSSDQQAGGEVDRSFHRIVIDPGHGGKDRGSVGPTGLEEKLVTLDLAQRLKNELLRRHEDYEVLLTRNNDTFLSLKTRTGIANNFKADLFISIHLNAVKAAVATGSETYYLSMGEGEGYVDAHYDEAGENDDSNGAEGNSDDIDENLSMILWDMAQTKYLEDSFRVASYIQSELNGLSGILSRGVKQAPLKVLKGAQMPAVLIEVAFLTNPAEEAKLRDPEFKFEIVRAVVRAIEQFSQDVERRSRPSNTTRNADQRE